MTKKPTADSGQRTALEPEADRGRRPDPEADEWHGLGSWLVSGGVRVDVSEAGEGSLVIRWQEPGFFSQVRLPMALLAELCQRIGWDLVRRSDVRGDEMRRQAAAGNSESAEAQLVVTRAAWAAQLRDLAPRIGLRALEGVPEEVLGVLKSLAEEERRHG